MNLKNKQSIIYIHCCNAFDVMKIKKQERVRASGCITYYIKEKKWYGWKTVKSFTSRKKRDKAFNFIENSM